MEKTNHQNQCCDLCVGIESEGGCIQVTCKCHQSTCCEKCWGLKVNFYLCRNISCECHIKLCHQSQGEKDWEKQLDDEAREVTPEQWRKLIELARLEGRKEACEYIRDRIVGIDKRGMEDPSMEFDLQELANLIDEAEDIPAPVT